MFGKVLASQSRVIAQQFGRIPKAPIAGVISRCLPIDSPKGNSYDYQPMNASSFKPQAQFVQSRLFSGTSLHSNSRLMESSLREGSSVPNPTQILERLASIIESHPEITEKERNPLKKEAESLPSFIAAVEALKIEEIDDFSIRKKALFQVVDACIFDIKNPKMQSLMSKWARSEEERFDILSSTLNSKHADNFHSLVDILDIKMGHIFGLLTLFLKELCNESEWDILKILLLKLPLKMLKIEDLKKLALITANGKQDIWNKYKIFKLLGVDTIQDPDFQTKIALSVTEGLGTRNQAEYCVDFPVPPKAVLSIIERSNCFKDGFTEYLAKKVDELPPDLRKDFALALIKKNPTDLSECLQLLNVGELADLETKKEIATLLVNKRVYKLDHSLETLNLGALQDVAFRKKLAFLIVEKYSFIDNNLRISNCLKSLRLDNLQDNGFVQEIFNNLLLQHIDGNEILRCLQVLGIDNIEDVETRKNMIRSCIQHQLYNPKESLSLLAKGLEDTAAFFEEVVWEIKDQESFCSVIQTFLREKGKSPENEGFRRKLALDLIHKKVRGIDRCLKELDIFNIQDEEFQKQLIEGILRNTGEEKDRIFFLVYLEVDNLKFLLEKMKLSRHVDLLEKLVDQLPERSNAARPLLEFFEVSPDKHSEEFCEKIALRLSTQKIVDLSICLSILGVLDSKNDSFRKELSYAVARSGDSAALPILRRIGGIGIEHSNPLPEDVQADLFQLLITPLNAEKVTLHDFLGVVSEENRFSVIKHFVSYAPASWKKFLVGAPLKEASHVKEVLKIAIAKGNIQPIEMSYFFFEEEYTFMRPLAHEFLITGPWSLENKKAICKQLFGYRNPQIAHQLLRQFILCEGRDSFYKAFTALCSQPKQAVFAVHKILPAIVLAEWMENSSVEVVPAQIAAFLHKYRDEFRNALKPLLSQTILTLNALHSRKEGSCEQKLNIFSAVCGAKDSPKDLEAMVKKLGLLSSVAVLNPSLLFKADVEGLSFETLKEIFFDRFFSIFSFPDLSHEEAMDLYLKIKMREPGALETYIGVIGNTDAKDTLQKFLYCLLKGIDFFKATRYATDHNPHLKYIQENYPQVFEGWKNLGVERLSRVVDASQEEKISLSSFFQDKLSHRHWHTATEDKLPRLTHFLQSGAVLEEPKGKTPFSDIEMLCIQLIQERDSLSEEDRKVKIEEVMKLTKEQNLELSNDLKALCSAKTTMQNIGVAKWTDDPEHLFLCGTDVEGSCQRVSGNPELNKCLMGYSLNGKIALLIIEDPISKKIQARRIARLLLHEGKPVLFVSRLYTAGGISQETVDPSLLALAKQCADKLSIPLFLPNTLPSTSKDATILESLEGPPDLPEYVDEALKNRVVAVKYKVSGYRHV